MDRNIAVVGCGYWGKNLVRNFAELGALHTICDSSSEVLSKLATLYPNVKGETNLDGVLTDKGIKGVVIALPAALHYPAARQALLAGKDVFVEKPITSKSSEAQELVELAEKRKRILMVGHLMLYHPAVPILKRHIQSGDLGEIYYLYSTRVNLGQVRRDESALWRLTPHDISLFLYLLIALPETVSAHGIGYLQPNLEDVVFIALKFPRNILAHIHVSWLDPHKTRQLTVVGSKKMAVFDDMEPEHKLRIYNKGVVDNHDTILLSSGILPLRSEEVFIPQVDLAEPLFLECQHFVHCIEERQQPLTDGRSGYQVVRILEAAEESLRNHGKIVEVH
jgi:UDP-2-acetamido-3-amino-2,3-dideoxy-glucuronate N-acetyltransferase